MAIFHLSIKPISRSAGRSATAAAAYRAGEKIEDERTGEIHDYRRKAGIASADLVLPKGAPAWATDRSKLWNAAEQAEKRKDACVAREYEVSLPAELSADERRRLALDFAQDMANREGCAVDVAIHAPHREGDQRNHHAHILRTTRKVGEHGLGLKLDTEQAGRKRKDDLEQVRTRWANLSNAALERAGQSARVDHRSLKLQGIEREPTVHLGPAATGYERRTGQASDNRLRQELAANERLAKAREAGELERASRRVESSILDLTGDLQAAKAERDRRVGAVQLARSGMADFRAQFEQFKAMEAAKVQAREALARQRESERERQKEQQRLEQERRQAEKAAELKAAAAPVAPVRRAPERDQGPSR